MLVFVTFFFFFFGPKDECWDICLMKRGNREEKEGIKRRDSIDLFISGVQLLGLL